MYKTKRFYFIFALLLSSLLMGSAPADGIKQDPPYPLPSKKAIITNNETGKTYQLPIVTNWVKEVGQGKYEAEFYVKIPKELLLESSSTTRGDEGSSDSAIVYESSSISWGDITWGKVDPSGSAKVYVRVVYSCSYQYAQYMTLYYVYGMWRPLTSGVGCTKLKVNARCYGEYMYHGMCIGNISRYVKNPASSAYYRLRPYWSGKPVLITYYGYYQSGTTTATITRGSSTWTFSFSIKNPCLW